MSAGKNVFIPKNVPAKPQARNPEKASNKGTGEQHPNPELLLNLSEQREGNSSGLIGFVLGLLAWMNLWFLKEGTMWWMVLGFIGSGYCWRGYGRHPKEWAIAGLALTIPILCSIPLVIVSMVLVQISHINLINQIKDLMPQIMKPLQEIQNEGMQ